MAVPTRWTDPLTCGTHPGSLIRQVADGAAADIDHQADCPHCTATLATLTSLWERIDELARERVEAPAALDAAVLRRVRRDLFVAAAFRVVGGIVPRLTRALLTYTGLIGEDDAP